MQFTGKVEKLKSGDVAEVAALFDLEEAHLRTVMEVETSGRGFDAAGHVERLFEPHRFYAELKEAGASAKLKQAVSQGVAYPKWKGPGSYPKTPDLRWKQFLTAVAIDETAAIRSASWGLGQIMGSEYAEAGYDSPQGMVKDFWDGERQQLIGMCKLIAARKLDVQLRKFPDMAACKAFARRYNGVRYAENKYHTKLHDAYVRWAAKAKSSAKAQRPDVVAIGESSERVKAMQTKLNELGYLNNMDGKFGPATRGLVLAWQADNDRPTDGTMDPDDLAALEVSPPKPISQERAETTAEDLKDTSTIVKDGDITTKVAATTAAGGGAVKLLDSAGLLDQATDLGDKADQANTALEKSSGLLGTLKDGLHGSGLDKVLLFISDHMAIIAICVLVGVVFLARRIIKARVKMTQTGQAV